jgi:hypothetical protein
VLFAVGNTLDSLANVVIFDAKVTYLSFPISNPRELAAEGDRSFVEVIDQAHQLAAREMCDDHSRSFVSPLSIDELPLVFKAKALPESDTEVEFSCVTDRWNLDELWGNPDLVILPGSAMPLRIPLEQLDGAAATLRTDVGWRDRRLVLQSDSLAIVCPKPPAEDRITRGVAEEIQTAVPLGISCNIWQKPEWDQDDFVGGAFPAAGSMGIGQTQSVVRKLNSLEALIRAKP